VALLAGAARRRRAWALLPAALDPGALVVLASRHAAALADGVRALAAGRVELAAPSSPYPPAAALARAATLSRAAYGYAAAAGHLASVSAYARMHTLGRATEFDASAGASAGANSAAAAGLAGLDPAAGHLLATHWAAALHRPAHFVAADPELRAIVIAVRGTLGASDALSNLAAEAVEVCLLGVEGGAHAGMLAAATFVHCATAGALAGAAVSHPGWPVVVVGHSMGGGVATILAALLVDSGGVDGLGRVSAICVGPAAVFTPALAEAVDPFVTSVVLGADCVPRLSVASVEGALLELGAASPTLTAAAGLGHAAVGLGRAVADLAAAAAAVVAPSPPPPPAPPPPPPPPLGPAGGAGLGAIAALALGEEGWGRGGARAAAAGEAAATAAAAVAAAAAGSAGPVASSRRAGAEVEVVEADGGRGGGGRGRGAAGPRPSSPPPPPPTDSPAPAPGPHPEPLLVAGRILWVLPPGELARAASGAAGVAGGGEGEAAAAGVADPEAAAGAAAAAAARATPLLLAAPRETFARLLLTTDAAVDHLPDAYCAALDAIPQGGGAVLE